MLCSSRRKTAPVRPEAKWDYISLKDFKSSSGFTVAAYVYLYISLLISVAVYGIDSFTAVSLLVFHQWASSIEPTQLIDINVSKYIFGVCIIASFVNLAFEHIRAWRIMRRGSVAESYLDTLAVRLESTRMGNGQGWRRFLVFAELTKSKKGAEYVALFTYFSFQSWIRVIFCSGPRQVVNALTLYGVFKSELLVDNGADAGNTIMKFFQKVEALAQDNYQQAVVLSGMLFTLVIWVISALSFLLAVFFYVFFLWHYIPKQDGGLSGYCERKINKRLMKIVSVKVNKAIAKEEEQRARAELKAAKKAGEQPPIRQQATLPTIPDVGFGKEDKLAEMPTISRNDTMATLPVYTSRPQTPSNYEMTAMNQKRPVASRKGTQASQSSYSSRAPLLDSAAGMGRSSSPTPTVPQIDLSNYPPARTGTAVSNRNFGPGQQPQRILTNNPRYDGSYSQSPAPYSSESASYFGNGGPAFPPPVRSPTANSMDSYGRPTPHPTNQFGPRPGPPGPSGPPGPPGAYGRPMYDDMNGPASPAMSTFSNRGPPANAGPRPGYPGRPTYDDGMNGRASPAPSTFTNRGPPGNAPRPGYPGRPTYDNGMDGRSSPAPSAFANRGPHANPGPTSQPMFDDIMDGRASPAPSTFANRAPPANPGPQPGFTNQPMFDDIMDGRASPAPSTFSSHGPAANGPIYNGPAFTATSPTRSATNPMPPSTRPPFSPQRNMTAPMPPRPGDYVMRPGTAASQRSVPARLGPVNGPEAQWDSQGPPRP